MDSPLKTEAIVSKIERWIDLGWSSQQIQQALKELLDGR